MKRSLLEYICCPICHGGFSIQAEKEERIEVMEGDLICSCQRYPIKRGVPRILTGLTDERNWSTAERFGEEWNQFSTLTNEYENQFLDWIKPVERGFFRDKVVLDAGCGKGRHVLYANKFGAKTVIGIDLSHAVDAAFVNTGRLPNVHIIQADIYNLPFKPVFDYAYSLGVLHHTPDPKKSFLCMVDKVKPGGSASAWVYGREGNGWIIYIVNPIRKITSVLPLFVTKSIAYMMTVVLQLLLVLLYRPVNRRPASDWLKKWLPYSAYLCSIADYTFKENHLIVFDHLLPGIAYYIRKEEFVSWFVEAKLEDVAITWRNRMSWRGWGRKIM